jgi:DNA-binding GntR family transcriptional regulator
MVERRYRKIYQTLKSGIQQQKYPVDSYLPSENELCKTYSITRTTARRALDELLKEGFIEKEHGKGSRVKERRQTLGLLTVKGFSEAVGQNVRTTFLQKPQLVAWPDHLPFKPTSSELAGDCLFFERLRGVVNTAVMLERNWFSAVCLDGFLETEFVEGSFFKTLSNKYFIEITGSEQELRALFADKHTSDLLKVDPGSPILQISIKFTTSRQKLNIYSQLFCNTDKYPIGNFYNPR